MKLGFTPVIPIIEILFIRIPVIPDESFAAAVGFDAPFREKTSLFLPKLSNFHAPHVQDQIMLPENPRQNQQNSIPGYWYTS
jgi:hypothetical protein